MIENQLILPSEWSPKLTGQRITADNSEYGILSTMVM